LPKLKLNIPIISGKKKQKTKMNIIKDIKINNPMLPKETSGVFKNGVINIKFNFDKLMPNKFVKDEKESMGFNFDKLISSVSVKKKIKKDTGDNKSSLGFNFKMPKINIGIKKKRVVK
jgi:hypothetical protein